MIVTPNNLLEAVNEVLSAVGSPPALSLDGTVDANIDVINAQTMIQRVNREVQSRGWAFNTQTNVFLPSDIFSNRIAYLYTYLKVVGSTENVVNREGYFYNLDTNSYSFPDGVTLSILVNAVDFDYMPEVHKKYVTCRAARLFQSRYLTSQELDAELQNAELEANRGILDYELEYGKYTIFGDTYISGQLQRR